MKRKIFNFLFVLFVTLGFASCDETTKDISDITYYPTIELNGDATMYVDAAEGYVEPGAVAMLDGEEVDYTTSVIGEFTGFSNDVLDSDVADYYHVNYTAANELGFSATETREVIMVETGDLTTNIAGLYTSTVDRDGSKFENLEYVLISKISDSEYIMSCGIGAYYQLGREYGLTYAAPAEITANNIASNDFTIPDYSVRTFGGDVQMTSFTVDPTAKTITYHSDWAADAATTYGFDVVLTQVDITDLQ